MKQHGGEGETWFHLQAGLILPDPPPFPFDSWRLGMALDEYGIFEGETPQTRFLRLRALNKTLPTDEKAASWLAALDRDPEIRAVATAGGAPVRRRRLRGRAPRNGRRERAI
jgi:hypothetical protein